MRGQGAHHRALRVEVEHPRAGGESGNHQHGGAGLPRAGECAQGGVAVTQNRLDLRRRDAEGLGSEERRRRLQGAGKARCGGRVALQPVEHRGGGGAPGAVEFAGLDENARKVSSMLPVSSSWLGPGSASVAPACKPAIDCIACPAHSPVRRARSAIARAAACECAVGSTSRIAAASGSIHDPSAAANAGPRSPKRPRTCASPTTPSTALRIGCISPQSSMPVPVAAATCQPTAATVIGPSEDPESPSATVSECSGTETYREGPGLP